MNREKRVFFLFLNQSTSAYVVVVKLSNKICTSQKGVAEESSRGVG
jgi:hypothetical protein